MDPQLYPDISSPEARQNIKSEFRAMVAAYKDHPSVLMWSIGNELNSPSAYGDKLNDLFTLINEIAQEARAEEGTNYHPVTTPLADINLIETIATYEPLTPNLDSWGANIHRGASFGTLFNDFKKASSKPLIITGFGIDAYDERVEDEYEKVGIPYQADYAELLWKEIQANWDVCPGGVVRAYTDEWWLGNYGNTLGGCPDPDPSFHSPCGHPSTSDPDEFINDEWFGIMRVVSPTLEKGSPTLQSFGDGAGEGGFPLDTLEPREIYNTLKYLWTVIEVAPQPGTSHKIPGVRLSVKPLDLTKTPTVEELMAAGQFGGQLYPTREIGGSPREERISRSFAEAIEAWNRHEYKKGVELFKRHAKDYPDSPWVSEAVLHVGCDAQYHGRYTEAEESFRWIIEENKGKDHDGAKRLLNKARLRLATLKVNQNNFQEAKALFATLFKEGSDWRDRTYASHWIQRLSRYSGKQLSMLNCGTQALAYLLKKNGREQDARNVLKLLPESEPGHSLKSVSELASQYGYDLSGVKLSVSDLKDLPLPAIMHIQGKNPGDSGHYWILERVHEGRLELFDPQGGSRFEQTPDQFTREWSGNALVFSGEANLPWDRLGENQMNQLYGGCCGVPMPEDDQGDPDIIEPDEQKDDSCHKGYGSPIWKVNKINMNLFVRDIPFWYNPPIGPPVRIQISYNSQSSINNYEPLGNKWQFNYATYLTVDTGDNVTVFMPDGRRDVYTPNGGGGYNPPYQVFNTLTKIAENHYELKLRNNVVYVYNKPIPSSQQPFLVEIRDPHNHSLTFGYDSNVRLTTITDALGRATTLTYADPNNPDLVTSVSDLSGRQASFGYDTSGNLRTITDMGGFTATLTYVGDNYLGSIQNSQGTWGFYIEPADGVIAYFDDYPPPGDHTWESYRITITNPLNDKEEYFYHGGCGYLMGINECEYTWYVSPKHYVTYVNSSINNFKTAPKTLFYHHPDTKYPAHGEIGKIISPAGGSITFDYDLPTRDLTTIWDGNNNLTRVNYEGGNLKDITDPLGNKFQFGYNANNNLEYVIDPADRLYDFVYYPGGNDLQKVIDPKNGETSFTYNSYGQLETLTDARRGDPTVFAYYESGDFERYLHTVTNPVGGVDSYTYDSRGRVYSHTDPNQNTTTFPLYDDMNRIRQIVYQDQTTKTFTYDCCRLESVTDVNGTVSFTYGPMKRLSSVTDVYGKVISYSSYDKNGNLETLTYPGNKLVTYEYDKANRLTKVTDWLNNVTQYEYDAVGNLKRTIYPNGTTITYQYDIANRLTTIIDAKADGTLNAVYNYVLDSLGNRKEIKSHQPLNPIPSPPPSIISTHDADNRLQTAGTTDYEYDANGNLDTVTLGSDVRDHTWDYENRLTRLTVGGNVYEYKYDGLGNRVSRKVNGLETRYVVDPRGLPTVLAETDADGNVTAYYVYGLGLISKITPSDQVYYYHFDGIGSTAAISDSSGSIVNNYAYDEFGKLLDQVEAVANPFKYVGQYGVMDEGNGLLYMRARYYDPEVGRFISKDPIGFAGGLNLYSYVGNSPLSRIDPSGLDWLPGPKGPIPHRHKRGGGRECVNPDDPGAWPGHPAHYDPDYYPQPLPEIYEDIAVASVVEVVLKEFGVPHPLALAIAISIHLVFPVTEAW
jgi:RHS repeat-associated protein